MIWRILFVNINFFIFPHCDHESIWNVNAALWLFIVLFFKISTYFLYAIKNWKSTPHFYSFVQNSNSQHTNCEKSCIKINEGATEQLRFSISRKIPLFQINLKIPKYFSNSFYLGKNMWYYIHRIPCRISLSDSPNL